MLRIIPFLLSFIFIQNILSAQECIGGQIQTNEAYQYGRFEVAMRSAGGDGIVSSFFLYNLDVGCNWPEENNELDIEMLGNGEDLLFTTHYPNLAYHTDYYTPSFNPHEEIHEYAFEWEPGIVRWFVDGELANVQDQAFVEDLVYPMRIIMNLWASEVESWTGPWDPSIMPVESEYDFVRFYEYTPGTGNYGTGNNYTLSWEDEFDTLDSSRWTLETFGGFDGNYCTFKSSSVEIENGKLYLQLEAAENNPELIPVTFSVDLNEEIITPADFIYLNGTFNDWCGTCEPMTINNGVWSKTIDLLPGEYQYLFTKNIWEENGGAPVGSECDFNPCDEYANYGFIVPENSEPIVLDTPCWGSCSSCSVISNIAKNKNTEKRLIKIFDILGRERKLENGRLLLFLYDDGSVEKRFQLE